MFSTSKMNQMKIDLVSKVYPEIPLRKDDRLPLQLDLLIKKALSDSAKRLMIVREVGLENVHDLLKDMVSNWSITDLISYVPLGNGSLWYDFVSSSKAFKNESSILGQGFFVSYQIMKLIMVSNLKDLLTRSNEVRKLFQLGWDKIPSVEEMEFLSKFEFVSSEILFEEWINMDLALAFVKGKGHLFDGLSTLVNSVNPTTLLGDKRGRKLLNSARQCNIDMPIVDLFESYNTQIRNGNRCIDVSHVQLANPKMKDWMWIQSMFLTDAY